MDYKKELDRIKGEEREDIHLEIQKKNFVLYGAGKLGKMAMNLFQITRYSPKYIIDKQEKGEINGIPIKTLDELEERSKREDLFLICICTIPYNEIVNELKNNGVENTISFFTYAYMKFPALISNGWFIERDSEELYNKISQICSLLKHDEFSIHHYLQFCWWKIKGKEVIDKEYPVLSGKKYFDSPNMPPLKEDEVLVDCGCHDGETIKKFLNRVHNHFKKIIAFEPDKRNMEMAQQRIENERVVFDNRAVSDKTYRKEFFSDLGFASKIVENGNGIVNTVSIDDLDIFSTIIKIHVEGEEYHVLQGAIHTIMSHRPIIMIFADHSMEGIYEIPIFIEKLKSYKLYFNLHDYCGNSAVYYMIPYERIPRNESGI